MFKENKIFNEKFIKNFSKLPNIVMIPILLGSLAFNEIKAEQNQPIIVDVVSETIIELEDINLNKNFINFPEKFTSQDIVNNLITSEMLENIIYYNQLFDDEKFEEHEQLKASLFWEIESNNINNVEFTLKDKINILGVMNLFDNKEMDKKANILNDYLKFKNIDFIKSSYDDVSKEFIEEFEYLTFLPLDMDEAENDKEKKLIEKLNFLESILNNPHKEHLLSEEDILLIAYEYEKENDYFIEKLKESLGEIDR